MKTFSVRISDQSRLILNRINRKITAAERHGGGKKVSAADARSIPFAFYLWLVPLCHLATGMIRGKREKRKKDIP